MKQHLGRQSGVQNVEVSLIDGRVDITPKNEGEIDPAELLKATYDSGVTAAEMDMIAQGKIAKDAVGHLAFQVAPNRSFAFSPNDLSKALYSLAGSSTVVTLRGRLYKKSPGRKREKPVLPLTFLVLEIQKKE